MDSHASSQIKLIIVKVLFIISIICSTGECGTKEAYAYLKQNQETIINALSQCHPPESPLFNFPCNFYAMNPIKTWIESSSVNDSIIELTVREFLRHIIQISSLLNNRRTGIISDSISITFLTELIKGCSEANEKEHGFASEAAREVISSVSYPALHKYKNQINAAVMNSCLEPHLKKRVRIFTFPNESERQALLKERFHFEDVPLKARLGDSVAIEGLRARYQNAKYFADKESAIKQIFVSGQTELIKMVLADFNNPMYDVFVRGTAPPCTGRSTKFETLQGLRRMHPEEKLINEEFLEMTFNFEASPEQVRQYLKSVTKWMERKYAMKIENKSKVTTFGRICIR